MEFIGLFAARNLHSTPQFSTKSYQSLVQFIIIQYNATILHPSRPTGILPSFPIGTVRVKGIASELYLG